MVLSREQLESREKQILAPYAVKSVDSRGRQYEEAEDAYRTCFQRDRDRIIHTKAFRRLKGKTQVFVAHYGDHYRSRLVHSMEVAQLSRDISRTLNLNEDLAEAIGLAHDLGHTPFGHAGQDEMHEIMKEYGSRFEHNEQSRRVVEVLEEKLSGKPGLNLSFEVIDGLIKHRTTFDNPEKTDTLMPSIEAQVVNVADEIAYQNHDIDDGLRSGILTVENLRHLELWNRVRSGIDSGLPFDLGVMATISSLVTLMVNDLVAHTNTLIESHAIESVEQVYQIKDYLSCFSPEMKAISDELKTYLFKNFYQSKGVAQYNQKGKEVIRFLFIRFMADPTLLPEKIRDRMGEFEAHVVVKDYIAGMTDNFALDLYRQLGA